ncbi:MAG: DNA/RNA-binding domain of Phe-tRNA-synthetase-like protein [Rhodothermales bacterium]|jgi:DNA/RNA-binding domain of Phe-tRNA-synthetase-like protein
MNHAIIRKVPAIRSLSAITIEASAGTAGAVFGLVWAFGIDPGTHPTKLNDLIAQLVAGRAEGLGEEEDAVRRASRDILRFGRYKPTGRGKPASEYLLRAASEGDFPRISPPVDICNYISLRHLVPASVWDLDLAGVSYTIRRGRAGESYVFNAGGQEIGLEDLLLVSREPADIPAVNPVKDSHATKTHAETRNLAGVVYMPEHAGVDAASICEEFAALLGGCGSNPETGFRVIPGRS